MTELASSMWLWRASADPASGNRLPRNISLIYLMTTPATTRQAEDIRRRFAALGTVDEIAIYDLEYTAWEGSLA
jgi:hypothetical protein